MELILVDKFLHRTTACAPKKDPKLDTHGDPFRKSRFFPKIFDFLGNFQALMVEPSLF